MWQRSFGDTSITMYTGLIALALNIIVAVIVNLVMPAKAPVAAAR